MALINDEENKITYTINQDGFVEPLTTNHQTP